MNSLSQPDSTRSTFELRRFLWAMAFKNYNQNSGNKSIDYEVSLPNSPFVETFWRGRTEKDGVTTCSADISWGLHFLKRDGKISVLLRGVTTKATQLFHKEGDESLGISFKPGIFMPCLPINSLVNGAVILPLASNKTFWLNGSTWEFPTYDNIPFFVNRLIRQEILVVDPVVEKTLKGQPQDFSTRSIQYRFLRSTGLTHNTIQQIERARLATALLGQGVSTLDTAHEAGYFDQSHLTNSLKRFTGQTPAQILTGS